MNVDESLGVQQIEAIREVDGRLVGFGRVDRPCIGDIQQIEILVD